MKLKEYLLEYVVSRKTSRKNPNKIDDLNTKMSMDEFISTLEELQIHFYSEDDLSKPMAIDLIRTAIDNGKLCYTFSSEYKAIYIAVPYPEDETVWGVKFDENGRKLESVLFMLWNGRTLRAIPSADSLKENLEYIKTTLRSWI